jgi:AcrR family transcriptional regulator
MDARQIRTRNALALTICDLAGERSLTDISVTDVATRAGISRPTFYAHADSPGALLGTVLAEQLAALPAPATAFDDTHTGDAAAELTRFLSAFVEHVQRNRDLYRRNVRLRLPPELRDILLDHLELGLTAHLDRHPHLAPRLDGAASSNVGLVDAGTVNVRTVDAAGSTPHEHRVFAAIAASATVAALENWLRLPEPTERDRVVAVILTGIAEWWSV